MVNSFVYPPGSHDILLWDELSRAPSDLADDLAVDPGGQVIKGSISIHQSMRVSQPTYDQEKSSGYSE